jgi:predicted transcriptional regulator
MPKNIKSDMMSIINELMERKQKYFKEIKRLILEYTVEEKGENFDLSVVSSLIKNN